MVHQCLKRLQECLSLGKNEQGMPRRQARMTLTDELAEHTLCSIAPNGIPKPLSDNDAHSRRRGISLGHQQIEESGGTPLPSTLHLLNVAAGAEENVWRP